MENYKKIHEYPNARVYKFNTKLTKGSRGNLSRFITHDEMVEEPTEYFIVSDANTHTERLVFPMYFGEGFTEEDLGKQKCIYKGNYCAGIMTWMIYGGDSYTIKEDKEYLDELWEVNQSK